MKKILIHIALLAGIFAAFSCSKNLPPVFDDANAFVAFDTASASIDEAVVDENGEIQPQTEILRLPVTLGSVKGLAETIKFNVTDGTAKAGVNFNLKTTSGTLSFDANNRTQYIEFEALYYDQYTGDLSFTVELTPTDNVAVGATNICKVTIGDVDHPLADLIGAYTMSGTDYWDGPSRWTLTLYKDEKDDHMVWLDNLYNNAGWAGRSDLRFYGNVNDDLTTITIPLGQTTEYKYSNGEALVLLGLDADFEGYDSGNTVVTIVKDASGRITGLDFGEEYGFWVQIPGAGNIGIVLPGLSAVKN